MKGRVSFVERDPQNGDASITISKVTRSDAMNYFCHVKKLPEFDKKMMTLRVMEGPSQPMCNLQGELAHGNDVTLTCSSLRGESPLTYTWAKICGNQVLPANAVVDTVRGTLHISNITERDCGRYRCTVESLVGSKSCELVLPCPETPEANESSAQLIAISFTVVLVILVTIITVGCLCCRKETKRQDSANEIVDDVSTAPQWVLKNEEKAPSLLYKAKDQNVTMSV
ncbi:coxsackievirus and adenovirus receptor homolog [Corythoichthys intestinalis]|uniref:coxsackievirus and adenovirus receptor homolog n=1 Tax=Corythoichthys intestinalis TaxID=161448 RepID=UPI0025A645E2|nr:coxsackievirus and adenovirus receptor homolog [Corythoichthys intestinalis]